MSFYDDVDFQRPGFGRFYDELPLWSAPFALMLLEYVPLRPGITVMDVGAGTGFLSIELAQRCGADAKVVAVDPWAAGVARLREKLDYLGLSSVRVLWSDAASLELADASVDLIVSNLGVNNFENADAVLDECFRVAKPGGTLALTTNLVGHMQEFYDSFRAVLEELDLGECLPAFDEHVAHRGTVLSVEALIERARFRTVRCERRSFRMRFADGPSLLRHWFIRLGFRPQWRELVPDERVQEVFSLLEERLSGLALRRGSLDLSIPMLYLEARKP